MNNLTESFFNILFNPVETFKNFESEKPYKLPLIIVITASFFLSLLFLSQTELSTLSIFSFIYKGFWLVIYWLFFCFFIDLMARIFMRQGYFAKLLTLTSLSFVPWIFLAPLKLLKNAGAFASTIALILIFGVWIWTFALQILAISETYSIHRKNAIIIFLIPFLGSILYLIWLVDFFNKLAQFSTL